MSIMLLPTTNRLLIPLLSKCLSLFFLIERILSLPVRSSRDFWCPNPERPDNSCGLTSFRIPLSIDNFSKKWTALVGKLDQAANTSFILDSRPNSVLSEAGSCPRVPLAVTSKFGERSCLGRNIPSRKISFTWTWDFSHRLCGRWLGLEKNWSFLHSMPHSW